MLRFFDRDGFLRSTVLRHIEGLGVSSRLAAVRGRLVIGWRAPTARPHSRVLGMTHPEDRIATAGLRLVPPER
eukprot:8472357-Alexandrium_andersonii.AAC.1